MDFSWTFLDVSWTFLAKFIFTEFLQNSACVISERLVDTAPHDFTTHLDYMDKRGMHRDIYFVHGKNCYVIMNKLFPHALGIFSLL